MPTRRIALSRHDFSLVSRDSSVRRAVTPHFSATISSHAVGLAVVVSKKVAKSSVSRHLLKRRVREAAHPSPISTVAAIIYARVGATELTYAEITAEIQTLLS